jgi:hypothetical protein
MAQQLLTRAMEDQGCITAGALHDHATISTENMRRRSSAVEEQNSLFTCVDDLAEFFLEGAAEEGSVSSAKFLAHINRSHLGKLNRLSISCDGLIARLQVKATRLLSQPCAMPQDSLG